MRREEGSRSLGPRSSLVDLVAQRADRLGFQRTAEGALRQRLTAGVEHEHSSPDQRRQRAGESVEPALGEHHALQAFVRRQGTAQHRVLLVDQLGEGGLGDGDERNLVGHLEHRKVTLGGGLHERRRNLPVTEAHAEAQAGQLMVGQARDELALALGRIELHPRRQQQLATGEKRRRVLEL